MISEQRGNLLEATTDALVNTVNTVGVMGKGIALQFKRAYPENYKTYEQACNNGEVQLGKMLVVPTQAMSAPHFIINFPTKNHWRSPSKLEDIRAGLEDLVAAVREHEIGSIALPPLGCGNGGLSWREVYPLIQATAARLPDVRVLVYPPQTSPRADAMPIRTKRPAMTERRAALLLAFHKYVEMSFVAGHAVDREFSIIEAQKIAYFLQVAGWQASFEFTPSHFGPYAQTVDQWLSAVEGHFLTGYGDGTSGSRAVLRLNQRTLDEARAKLRENIDFDRTISRFESLVRGFESPYGVELLSTVHYIIQAEAVRPVPFDKLLERLGMWSRRKAALFRPGQAKIALDHLVNVGAVAA